MEHLLLFFPLSPPATLPVWSLHSRLCVYLRTWACESRVVPPGRQRHPSRSPRVTDRSQRAGTCWQQWLQDGVSAATRPARDASTSLGCCLQDKAEIKLAPLTPICWSKDQHLHCLPRLMARFRLESFFFSSSRLVLNPRLVLQLGIKSRILHIINRTDVALDATSVCEGPT